MNQDKTISLQTFLFLVYKNTCKQKILNNRDNNMITRILTLYLSS